MYTFNAVLTLTLQASNLAVVLQPFPTMHWQIAMMPRNLKDSLWPIVATLFINNGAPKIYSCLTLKFARFES